MSYHKVSYSALDKISVDELNRKLQEEIMPTYHEGEYQSPQQGLQTGDNDSLESDDEEYSAYPNEPEKQRQGYSEDDYIETNSQLQSTPRFSPESSVGGHDTGKRGVTGVLDSITSNRSDREVASERLDNYCARRGEILNPGEHGAVVRYLMDQDAESLEITAYIKGYRAHTFDWASAMEKSLSVIEKQNQSLKLRISELERIKNTSTIDSYNIIEKVSLLYEQMNTNKVSKLDAKVVTVPIIKVPEKKPGLTTKDPSQSADNLHIPKPPKIPQSVDPVKKLNEGIAKMVEENENKMPFTTASALNKKFRLKLNDDALINIDQGVMLTRMQKAGFESVVGLLERESLGSQEKTSLARAISGAVRRKE